MIEEEEGEEGTLISFLGPIYTNKDLTLKANSKIKMKMSYSKTVVQIQVSWPKQDMKAESAFCGGKSQRLQTVAIC